MEDELTHLNPPVTQGWVVAMIVVVVASLFFILRGIAFPDDVASLFGGLRWLLGAIGAWVLVEVLIGSQERELELCAHGVAIRRWTDVWLRREGRVLGDPATIAATVEGDRLILSGAGVSSVIPLTLWPPTARLALHDELEAWGVDFGHDSASHGHHRKHHRHDTP